MAGRRDSPGNAAEAEEFLSDETTRGFAELREGGVAEAAVANISRNESSSSCLAGGE